MQNSELKFGELNGEDLKIAIILPYYNENLGLELLENTKAELLQNHVTEDNISIHRVPGAMEIPFLAKKIALTKKADVIISLGVIIQGGTPHFKHVCDQSINGCMQVQLETQIPIVIGILTLENLEQAKERIDKNKMNKGAEFAKSAIFMATKI